MSRMVSVTLIAVSGMIGVTTMAVVATVNHNDVLTHWAGIIFILGAITTLIMADF